MNRIQYTAVAVSDKGRIRTNNEDNFYFNGIHLTPENRDERNCFCETPTGSDFIYGVFDGMGGEALGEEASLIAAKTVKQFHERIKGDNVANCDSAIFKIVEDANKQICDKMVETGERRIGTTFAAITIKNDRAKVYNVGDSRVYLFRNRKLNQLSVDDTTAQRLVNMGVLTKEKAKTHEDRHRLTQHLGIFKDELIIEPHVAEEIEIKKGDRFLLCSDGLTDMVEDEKIAEIIQGAKTCEEAAERLVEEALNNGGRDNVTVVMVSAGGASAVNARSKKNKVVLPCVIAILLIAASVFGIYWFGDQREEPTQSTSGSVTATKLTWKNPIDELIVGDKGALLVQSEPDDATGIVTWGSSDQKIVTVSDKGFYEAKSAGTAFITAQLDGVSCSLEVTVFAPVERIVLKNKDLRLNVGEKVDLDCVVEPANAKQSVTFKEKDPSVVSVSKDGTLVGKEQGETTVIISAGKITETITVEVVQPQKSVKPAETPKKDLVQREQQPKPEKTDSEPQKLQESEEIESEPQIPKESGLEKVEPEFEEPKSESPKEEDTETVQEPPEDESAGSELQLPVESSDNSEENQKLNEV